MTFFSFFNAFLSLSFSFFAACACVGLKMMTKKDKTLKKWRLHKKFVFKCIHYFCKTFTFSFASCSSFSLKILSASKASCFFCFRQEKELKKWEEKLFVWMKFMQSTEPFLVLLRPILLLLPSLSSPQLSSLSLLRGTSSIEDHKHSSCLELQRIWRQSKA